MQSKSGLTRVPPVLPSDTRPLLPRCPDPPAAQGVMVVAGTEDVGLTARRPEDIRSAVCPPGCFVSEVSRLRLLQSCPVSPPHCAGAAKERSCQLDFLAQHTGNLAAFRHLRNLSSGQGSPAMCSSSGKEPGRGLGKDQRLQCLFFVNLKTWSVIQRAPFHRF